MGPLSLPVAIQAGTSLFQLGKSLFGKQERPQYEIPEAVQQQASKATLQAQTARRAGRSIADEMIARQQASATESAKQAASSGVNVASGALSAMLAGNQAMRQQDVIDMQDLQRRQGIEQQALSSLGQQQLAQFQFDKVDPYTRKMQEKSALMGAGLQNLMGAAKGFEARKALQG